MSSVAETLRSLPVFGCLTSGDRDLLAHSFVVVRLESGESVPARVDDSPICLGIVESGAAVWECSSVLANLWDGSTFGDFSPDYRFDTTVAIQARGSATIALLTRQACLCFLSESPEAGLSLLRGLAGRQRARRPYSARRVDHAGPVNRLVRHLVAMATRFLS